MLTFDQRMTTIESLTVQTYNEAQDLITDELDTVEPLIFDQITDLDSRIDSLSNSLDMIEKIIEVAQKA